MINTETARYGRFKKCTCFQIAAAELGLFQQKLEDEVKKDQQEKRENQETLKMLKMDNKDLTDIHEKSETLAVINK